MRLSYICLAILASIIHVSIATAACDHWLFGPLHQQPEGLESDEMAFASTIWSPPSGGTMLVVGGTFTTTGGVPVNYLAGWDGASWRDIGGGVNEGVNGAIESLAAFNGHLIVGGNFDAVGPGGSVPARKIARFDGTTWHALGEGLQGNPITFASCNALAVYNGQLIAGGFFRKAGDQVATNVAKWNGSAWSALGPAGGGVGSPSTNENDVRALRVHVDNFLYIGGRFQTAGGVAATGIVQFNGSTYAALASGISPGFLDRVDALHSFGNELIAGGGFTTAGGLPAVNIARWIPGGEFGGAWATMGSGLPATVGNGGVTALQPFNGQLIAGGTITGVVRAWNGSTWTTLGGGVSGDAFAKVSTFNVFNGNLIAAGSFSTAGSVPATNIAQWNTSFWSALQAPTPQVFAFETLGSRFIAAGSFLQSTTNQTPAHNIIGWNGATLTRVQNGFCCGEGTNGTIRALKSNSGSNELVVGGEFTAAGGVVANRIARYTEPGLLPATWSAMGNGFNASVLAVERVPASQFLGEAIFAGGEFTASGSGSPAFSRVAQWFGSPASWTTMGTGFNNTVRAIKAFNSSQINRFVIAGGDFTTASGVAANRIAMWGVPALPPGPAWAPMGSGFNGTVHAIERHNNVIYAAGEFTASGATPISHVARWTGTAWESIGGGTNGVVNALKSDGTHLYAIGGFTLAGGVPVNRVARWHATDGWSDVEGGTNDVVNTIGFYRGEVQVGLGISLADENDAPQPGKGWVRYSPTGLPWMTSNPISQAVNCHQTTTFTAQISLGYSPLQRSWRRNGVALNDGPTPYGSVISGAHTGTLTITDTRAGDAGSYDCVFSSVCGSVTSSAATLTVNNCCVPDITGDSVTDVQDLLAVIGAWGPCPAPPSTCLADIAPIGGDGVVNVGDLLAVIAGWGACP